MSSLDMWGIGRQRRRFQASSIRDRGRVGAVGMVDLLILYSPCVNGRFRSTEVYAGYREQVRKRPNLLPYQVHRRIK